MSDNIQSKTIDEEAIDLNDEPIDIPSLSNLPDFSSLTRQQTDVAQNEDDNEIKQESVPQQTESDDGQNTTDAIPFTMQSLDQGSPPQNNITDDTNNDGDNLGYNNGDEVALDLTSGFDDDDGDDALPSFPNLSNISRQTTDHAIIDEPDDLKSNEMMIDQIDPDVQNAQIAHDDDDDDDDEEEIIMIPPRVSNDKLMQTKPEINDSGNNNNNNDDNDQLKNVENEYLDSKLVMFDDDGNLIDNDVEQFISLNEDEDVADNDGVEEIEDDSINSFVEHNEPIICMNFNPKKENEIITGAQDENCFIWDIINFDASECISDLNKNKNMENNDEKKQKEKEKESADIRTKTGYFKLAKHNDTVMDCSWNSSGKYVATGSMDSTIKIYNYNKKMKLISKLDIGSEISYLCWHPNINNHKKYKNILMAGAYDKNVWIYHYDKNLKTFEGTQVLTGHSSEIECGGFTKFNDGKYAYSGDKDGVIIIWENIIDSGDDNQPFIPYNGAKKYVFKPGMNSNDNTDYHESSITTMDDCLSAPLLISGSSDSSVVLISYENGKIISKLGKHGDSVECVRFNKNYKKEMKYTHRASSSSLDGVVKIWDINEGKIRNELKHDDGIIVHEWFNTPNNSNLIATGCMNGTVNIWDSRNAQRIKQFKGHSKCSIQTLKISNNDKYIVSGGDDSIAMVWEV